MDILSYAMGKKNSGGGGGSSAMAVEITKSGAIYTMDKTFAEIQAAFEAGATIVCHHPDSSYDADVYTHVVGVRADLSDGAPYQYVVFVINRETYVDTYIASTSTDNPKFVSE